MSQIFISYHHNDDPKYKIELETQLKALFHKTDFSSWDDGQINTGDLWEEQIIAAMKAAQVAVLLISAGFLASEFISDVELPLFFQRWVSIPKILRIYPIIIKPCNWDKRKSVAQVQVRPGKGKCLAKMEEQEWTEELASIAGEIYEFICDNVDMEEAPEAYSFEQSSVSSDSVSTSHGAIFTFQSYAYPSPIELGTLLGMDRGPWTCFYVPWEAEDVYARMVYLEKTIEQVLSSRNLEGISSRQWIKISISRITADTVRQMEVISANPSVIMGMVIHIHIDELEDARKFILEHVQGKKEQNVACILCLDNVSDSQSILKYRQVFNALNTQYDDWSVFFLTSLHYASLSEYVLPRKYLNNMLPEAAGTMNANSKRFETFIKTNGLTGFLSLELVSTSFIERFSEQASQGRLWFMALLEIHRNMPNKLIPTIIAALKPSQHKDLLQVIRGICWFAEHYPYPFADKLFDTVVDALDDPISWVTQLNYNAAPTGRQYHDAWIASLFRNLRFAGLHEFKNRFKSIEFHSLSPELRKALMIIYSEQYPRLSSLSAGICKWIERIRPNLIPVTALFDAPLRSSAAWQLVWSRECTVQFIELVADSPPAIQCMFGLANFATFDGLNRDDLDKLIDARRTLPLSFQSL
jgi:hypothetical protein